MHFGIRGGKYLHWIVLGDFIFEVDEIGKFVQFDERLSKNYHVSMARYKDKYFRPALKLHEKDVEMFQTYFFHLPRNNEYLFNHVIDSLRTRVWYAIWRMSDTNLSEVIKLLHNESGLPFDGIIDKTRRVSLVSRCQQQDVPIQVGI